MVLKEYIIDRGMFHLQADVQDWKGAVRLGTNLLEKRGFVTGQYYQAILKSVKDLGPYFLIAPGLAMPHARPEEGVLQNGFSLLTLRRPVVFGDPENDPVDILLTLAAVDAETQNEEAIVQIVELLDNENKVEELRKANSLSDLERIFEALEG